MAAKGLTRKITRKQARSYKRLIPNGIGVTAIAALSNGKRSKTKNRSARKRSSEYAARYSSTKAILSGAKMKKKNKARKPKARLRGAAFKRSKQYKAMMAGLRKYRHPSKDKGGKWWSKRDHRKKKGPYRRNEASEFGGSYPSLSREEATARKASPAQKRAAKARAAAAQREIASRKRAAAKRRVALAAKRAANERKRVGKVYGRGKRKYKSVKAKVGGHVRATYLYADRKSKKTKTIPLWAKLGARSKKEFERKVASDPKWARKVVGVKRKRDRAASRLMMHGDIFTPNKSATVVPFESWSENMKPNRKKKTRKSRRTAAQKAATRKMIAANRRRSKSGSAPKRRRKGYRRNPKKGQKLRGAALAKARKNLAKARAAKKRKSRGGGSTKKSKKTKKSGSTATRKRVKTRKVTSKKRRAALVKALNKKARKHRTGVTYYENKRRRRRSKRKHYAENRRRHRRHYRRNAGSLMLSQIKSVAMIGAIVAAGFAAHRAVSYLVSEKLLANVSSFQTGSLATWRSTIAGGLVAAGGVALVSKVAPKHAVQIGAGMMVSFFHKLLLTVLAQANQPDAAAYLSGYPDAEGRAARHVAMGEYLQTSGFGEYIQGTNGFGAFEQAAAGFGASPMMQAAAGMGAPMMQAAAGVGEYIATNGLRGIGQFEQAAAGVGGMGHGYIDDGIGPNVDQAEYALTQAENMSGIGDIPLLGTAQNAPMQAQSIADAPTGARAGILEGEGGIFG